MNGTSVYELLNVREGSEGLEDFENTLENDMIDFDDCLGNESNILNTKMNNTPSSISNVYDFLGDESNPQNT